MKTKLFFFMCFFSGLLARGTVITVSNDGSVPADYNSFQQAINAASANDTIDLAATDYSYGSVFLTKKLTIRGAGNSILTHKGTFITNLSFFPTSAGSYVAGCNIHTVSFAANIYGITIANCSMLYLTSGTVQVEDSLFYNNRIYSLLNIKFTDTTFTNNIVASFYSSGTNSNFHIKNNYIGVMQGSSTGVVISNNVIRDFGVSDVIAFEGNMVMNAAVDVDPVANIILTDIDCVADLTDQDELIHFTHLDYFEYAGITYPDSLPNLNLLETSPGKDAGTDGTDIGIYGGEYPYVEGDTSVSEMYRYFPTPEEFAEGPQQDPIAVDQVLCTGARVLDLVATGTDIKWYKYAVGGSPLASTKKVVSGTYYVTETTDVESERLAVEITIDHCSSITSPMCGSTLMTKNSVIYAKSVPGAVQYRFRISDGSIVETLDKATRTFNLTETPIGRYNQSYTIDVATMVDGEWSGYGPSCALTTPAASTKIMDSQCGTEVTSGTILYADQVPGATQYRFRVTDGATVVTIDRASRTLKLNILPQYVYGTSYTVDVAVEVDGSFTSYGTTCVVNLAAASTKVTDIQCGTDITPDTIIYADLVPGATQYRFRITSGSNIWTIDRATRTMKCNMLPEYVYGTTYTIDVAVEVNGNFQSYGPACNVQLVLPTTNIHTMCGAEVATNTIIYANLVPGATQYRFRVSDGTTTTTLDRTTRAMKLEMLTESLNGLIYTIDVAVKIGGEFGEYGSACNVFLPLSTTQLTDEFCGATVTMETVLSVDPIEGADQYGFIVIPEAGNDYASLLLSEGTTFQLSEVPGLIESPTYTILVGAIIDGMYNTVGDSCTVTIDASGARYSMDITEVTTETQDVLAFPNPFSDAFSLAMVAGSVENVNIQVYDTAGRLVEDITLSPSELRYKKIGDNYSVGLYNVAVTQGSYQKALKMVKK